MRSSYLVLIALIVFAGCQRTAQPDFYDVPGPVLVEKVGLPSGAASMADMHHFAGLNVEISDAYYRGANWLDSHERVSAYVDSLARIDTQTPLHYLQQSAALKMVGLPVIDGTMANDSLWDAQHLEVLSHHVEMLVRFRNPQAAIITPALKRLASVWPQEKVAEAARTIAEAASEWCASEEDTRASMKGCNPGAQSTREAIDELKLIADAS